MRILPRTACIWLLAVGTALSVSRPVAAELETPNQPESRPAAGEVETPAGDKAVPTEDASDRPSREVGPKVAVGGSVSLRAGQTAETVVAVMGSATVEGEVQDAVVIVLGQGNIDGKVHGDVVAVLSDLELGPKAEVSGQVVRIGGSYKKDPGARIHGEETEVPLGAMPGYAWLERNIFKGVLWRPLPPNLTWAWLVGFAFVLLHLVVLLLMARPVQACSDTLRARPIRSFFVGFLAYLLFIPLLVLLSWTVIGIPVLACALIGAALLGKTAVYRVAGGQLLSQLGLAAADKPLLGWLVGTVVFYLLYMVPLLGWIAWFILAPLGVGAAVTAAFAHFREERGKSATPGGLPATPASAVGPTGPLTEATAGLPAGPPPVSAPVSASALPPAVSPLAMLPPIATPAGPLLGSAELASLPRVGFWPRLGATLLDAVLLGIICGMLSAPGSFFLFLLMAYHIAMWGWKGSTLGGTVLGLKCVRLDGRPLSWQVAVVRCIAGFISLAPCGLGFFWCSWTSDRQSWHDIIAGTTIVKMPRPFSLI
jgi:uncharacterized RDD family membrane protein YckC